MTKKISIFIAAHKVYHQINRTLSILKYRRRIQALYRPHKAFQVDEDRNKTGICGFRC